MSSFVAADSQSSINLAKQVHLCNSRKKKADNDAQLLLLVLIYSKSLLYTCSYLIFVYINALEIVLIY